MQIRNTSYFFLLSFQTALTQSWGTSVLLWSFSWSSPLPIRFTKKSFSSHQSLHCTHLYHPTPIYTLHLSDHPSEKCSFLMTYNKRLMCIGCSLFPRWLLASPLKYSLYFHFPFQTTSQGFLKFLINNKKQELLLQTHSTCYLVLPWNVYSQSFRHCPYPSYF